MVIRTMYFIGLERSSEEMVLFFALLAGAILLVHTALPLFMRLRLLAAEYFNIPIVSVLAALGIALMLLSRIPYANVVCFFAGGFLVGLSCGWATSIWMSTFHIRKPNPHLFAIPPALVVAVASYFCFRLLSSVSEAMGEGLMMALPLITIGCIIARPPQKAAEADEEAEGGRSLLVLVSTAAFFALAGGVVTHLAGKPVLPMSTELNFMVFYELVAAALMLLLCQLLLRFSARKAFPVWTGSFVLATLSLPLFALGLLMGLIQLPNAVSGVLWETSLWVLVIAVFAYDMQASPYAVNGLSVGLLFEAMCIGQVLTRMVSLAADSTLVAALAALYGLIFFVSLGFHLLRQGSPSSRQAKGKGKLRKGNGSALAVNGATEEATEEQEGAVQKRDARVAQNNREESLTEANERGLSEEMAYRFGLTQREVEILKLLAHGRSMKYIAEELFISYHTARTHVRHIYEKLNIHSKQELIDMMELPNGILVGAPPT
jgi:DNA-binding CsgD family transcriptional regulator